MAAGTPLGGTRASDFLHVLDALAVPLVVEGRKMMHRAVPLLIDVGMAALAGVGLHEVLRRNVAAMFGLRGAREEFSLRPIALAVHGFRRHERIGNTIRAFPGGFANPPRAGRDARGQKR